MVSLTRYRYYPKLSVPQKYKVSKDIAFASVTYLSFGKPTKPLSSMRRWNIDRPNMISSTMLHAIGSVRRDQNGVAKEDTE
jgi:hypothetical protein